MKTLLSLLAPFCLACGSEDVVKEMPIEITIQYAESEKFDLNNGLYTVYYINRPPSQIKFDLTEKEKKAIRTLYYELKLHKLRGKVLIEDECYIMPKLYTVISTKNKNHEQQELRIDEACDNFYFSNFRKAQRIKKFLQFVDSILKSKPEIRNAPQSDIFYL